MSKESTLQEIIHLMRTHQINQDEIARALEATETEANEPSSNTAIFNITNVFVYLGALIIFSGIIIFLNENWNTLNNTTRILVPLGFGSIAYIIAVLTNNSQKFGAFSGASFLISALSLPIGLQTYFITAGFSSQDPLVEIAISFLMLITFGFSCGIFKRVILMLFTLVFATWFITESLHWLRDHHFLNINVFYLEGYLAFGIGLGYLLIGRLLMHSSFRILVGILYTLGALIALCAPLTLGGWFYTTELMQSHIIQTFLWQLLAPLLIGSVIFASLLARSKSLLACGTIYLLIFIVLLTQKYFVHSLGWPISLILIGVLFMLTGYYILWLKRRYL